MNSETRRKLGANIGNTVEVITEDDTHIQIRVLDIDDTNKNIIVQNINESADELEDELVNHISDKFEIPFTWIKEVNF